jgi:acetyl-CoA C-acetyltransferase
MGIKAGEQELVVAGGVESMSRVPMNADRGGIDGHNRHLRELHPLVQQGISADLIATIEGFDRETCDRFALSSQQRYARAHAEGRLREKPHSGTQCRRPGILEYDEHPRASTTMGSRRAAVV